ncbi:MAG TPA: DUF2278 family protein [Humisphaera sp.]|jgi:hypothetical protein|nr:DUF2278 family protein [Humisphaera sp.]
MTTRSLKLIRWALGAGTAFLAAAASARAGQLPQYAYLSGALEPEKSFLEKIDPADKGKFLHYHIFLKTAAGVEYECVIDVNDLTLTVPVTYRIVSLVETSDADLAADFGPIFTATQDLHIISDVSVGLTPGDDGKRAAGALDYERHQGLLKAIRGVPWQQATAQTTADPLQWALPAFDKLLKPFVSTNRFRRTFITSTTAYVFGQPFTSPGHGMHVVHQNQADTNPAHNGNDATWQDGGVIVERRGTTTIPLLHNGEITLETFPYLSRQVLMTRFNAQTDFSVESNDLSPTAPPGQPATPVIESFPAGGISGDVRTYGPFRAAELEVTTSAAHGVPAGPNSSPQIQVLVKNGAFTDLNDKGDFTVTDHAMDGSAAGRVFARAYSPLQQFFFPVGFPPRRWIRINIYPSYYVRTIEIDPGSWNDSEADATLTIKHH